MSAQPSPRMVRLHVCGECRAQLLARGARHVPGPHILNLDTRCEAHGRTGALAAAHVVELLEDEAEALAAELAARPLAPIAGYDDLEDAPLVAELATRLLVGQSLDPTSDDAIAISVIAARKILATAKGR